jgi:predicted heme/steroid binding protein
MSMSKRVHIYTEEDVAAHKTASSCWISRNGKVYDVSSFLPDHPGGEDYILKYAGQDVVNVMKNEDEHDHSDSAYDMMEEYVIGRLGSDANIVSDGMYSAATLPLYFKIFTSIAQTGRHQTIFIPKILILLKTSRRISSLISESHCSARYGRRTSGACLQHHSIVEH